MMTDTMLIISWQLCISNNVGKQSVLTEYAHLFSVTERVLWIRE